jgi:hypothetical protein
MNRDCFKFFRTASLSGKGFNEEIKSILKQNNDGKQFDEKIVENVF